VWEDEIGVHIPPFFQTEGKVVVYTKHGWTQVGRNELLLILKKKKKKKKKNGQWYFKISV
jgi:hypothetical protein